MISERFVEMIMLDSCQKCGGAVIDYASPVSDSPLCLTCGWRHVVVPSDVLAEVEEHLGKAFLEGRYTHKQIGTGKPPLSGWEREKRRRQRDSDQSATSLAG